VLIPSYNTGATLHRALVSIGLPQHLSARVIVVDDGSDVPVTIAPDDVRVPWEIVRLATNVGKAGACNRGFARSQADTVIVLDADDELVPEWEPRFLRLLDQWPSNSPLAYGGTVTELGQSTGGGSGVYSREQWLNQEGVGEYLPIFRGEVARNIGYQTPGCRKICGTLSYARILQEGPLYIHPEVLRTYHTATPGSISKKQFDRRKSHDSYVCFHAARLAIEAYDTSKGRPSSKHLSRLYEREALYRTFGESRSAGIRFALENHRRLRPSQIARVCAAAALPRGTLEFLLGAAKRTGLVKGFG
jgi:glycosyltransferase involved in cell wall biosynthesis